MTKKQNNIYNRYLNSYASSLRDVYDSWSQSKENAMEYCRAEFAHKDGEGFRIISANTFQFTVGFTYTDKETGKQMFNYISRDNNNTWEI